MPIDHEKIMSLLEMIERLQNMVESRKIDRSHADPVIDKALGEIDAEGVE